MKRIVTALLALALLASLTLSFSACIGNESQPPIEFDKKYVRSFNNPYNTVSEVYVFRKDNTGTLEANLSYTYDSMPDLNYKLSGSVEFIWKQASDGGIYLFKTEEHYNADSTEGKTISLINAPLYFAEDMFTYTSHSEAGASYPRYIVEDSDLDKALATEKAE